MSELCPWSQCAGCISPVRPGDPVSARQWLGRYIGDDAAMARLRLLAGNADAEATPLSLDDQALADQLAARIASGAIRVCGARQAPALYAVSSTPAAAAAPAAPSPSPSSTAPAAAAPATPAPAAADTTFGSSMDPAAMAATLREAARDGVPFCEECARAAAMAAA